MAAFPFFRFSVFSGSGRQGPCRGYHSRCRPLAVTHCRQQPAIASAGAAFLHVFYNIISINKNFARYLLLPLPL